MISDKAITSVRAFFEDILRYASRSDMPTVWEFSDKKGIDSIKGSAKKWILSILPKQVAETYKSIESFAVREI
jgi:hypothetical protein